MYIAKGLLTLFWCRRGSAVQNTRQQEPTCTYLRVYLPYLGAVVVAIIW